MIRYFYCVLTNRIGKWNDLSEKVFLNAQMYIAQCPEDERKPFMAFVTGSELALRYLLHPMNGDKRLIKKDIKKISEKEFLELHTCILNHLLAIHFSNNGNRDASNVGKNFSKFTGKDFINSAPLMAILKNSNLDISNVSANAWNEICNILSVEVGFMKWFPISIVLSECYKYSVDLIRSNVPYIVNTTS